MDDKNEGSRNTNYRKINRVTEVVNYFLDVSLVKLDNIVHIKHNV